MAAQKEINLLPTTEFEKTRLGKFLNWALGLGRWIVIVTELIVILCFLSRFKLDRELIDLGETIQQQQAIIASLEELEKNFRDLQNRLAAISQLEKEQLPATHLLHQLSQVAPADLALEALAVKKNELEISGSILSGASLNRFLKALQEFPQFKKVILEEINQPREDKAIEFSLKIETK